jgi:HK97 family phage portal protein
MGVFDIFRTKQQTVEQMQSIVTPRTSSPVRNVAQIIAAYNGLPWLRAVVHKVSESIASTKWTVSIVKNSNGDLVSVDKHPLLGTLAAGNPFMSGFDVLQVAQIYLDLLGDAVIVISRDSKGVPDGLWPVPNNWVRAYPTGEKPWLEMTTPSGGQSNIPGEDLIWLKDPNPVNPYGVGSGTAFALADELDTDEYAAKFLKEFFNNGAMPAAIVGIPGAQKSAMDMFRQGWLNKFQGRGKSHQVSFVSAKPEVVKLGQDFKDKPIVELRQFLRNTVTQIYGMPPEILGIVESSNRATIDAAELIYARHVLVPRLERIRREFQAQLATQFGDDIILNYESPVPSNKEQELDAAKSAPQGTLTQNEWRFLAGFPPVDGGDVFEVQGVADSAKAKKFGAVNKGLSNEDIEDLAEELATENDAAELLLRRTWETELGAYGDTVLSNVGVDVSFDMVNPRVVIHIADSAATQVERVNDTTKSKIREALAESRENLEGALEASKRVQAVFAEASDTRAMTIARTEVNRSANFGSVESFRQSGVVDGKEWVSTPDNRTRDPHTELDGQERALSKAFEISGHKAQYPGDFGVAEMDIACRCTTVAVFTEKAFSKESNEDIVEQFEKDKAQWEKAALKDWEKIFKAQEKAVLRLLADAEI